MDILLADDDEKIRKALGSVLAERGYRVTTASNGLEALDRMEVAAPDLVITDYQMPEMDGLALLKAVRRRHPDTPVVLMTARLDVEVGAAGFRAGAWKCLRKPIRVEDLMACVEEARQRTCPGGQAQRSPWATPMR